jgi:hypothetical protein
VCGSMHAAICSSVVVCDSAHNCVRTVGQCGIAAVQSALQSTWQCVQQCAAVRQGGSARGSAWQCVFVCARGSVSLFVFNNYT